MDVRIVTDSACDLLDEDIDSHDVTVVPLTIRFGDEEFIDRVELSNDAFWRKLASSPTLPETSAPSVGAFETAFHNLVEQGASGIVCINVSSKLSGTMQSASVAAKRVGEDVPIAVIDSESATLGLGLHVLAAADLAREGAPVDDIVAAIEDRRARSHLYGSVDTLEYLRKGGRIGAARALLGQALSVKPVLEVREGVVAEAGKVRTRSKALRALADKVAQAGPIEQAFVADGQAPDRDELLDMVAAHVPRDKIVCGRIGPVIGTHIGPRSLGVGWVAARRS